MIIRHASYVQSEGLCKVDVLKYMLVQQLWLRGPTSGTTVRLAIYYMDSNTIQITILANANLEMSSAMASAITLRDALFPSSPIIEVSALFAGITTIFNSHPSIPAFVHKDITLAHPSGFASKFVEMDCYLILPVMMAIMKMEMAAHLAVKLKHSSGVSMEVRHPNQTVSMLLITPLRYSSIRSIGLKAVMQELSYLSSLLPQSYSRKPSSKT